MQEVDVNGQSGSIINNFTIIQAYNSTTASTIKLLYKVHKIEHQTRKNNKVTSTDLQELLHIISLQS